jgi:hypothetical protein
MANICPSCLQHTNYDTQSFLLASGLVSTLLNFTSLLLFHRLGVNYIPSGLTPILFSILYQYHRTVPSAYTFRIFGIRVTNKTFTYLMTFPVRLIILYPRRPHLPFTSPLRTDNHFPHPRQRPNCPHRPCYGCTLPFRPHKPQIVPRPTMACLNYLVAHRALSPSAFASPRYAWGKTSVCERASSN